MQWAYSLNSGKRSTMSYTYNGTANVYHIQFGTGGNSAEDDFRRWLNDQAANGTEINILKSHFAAATANTTNAGPHFVLFIFYTKSEKWEREQQPQSGSANQSRHSAPDPEW